MPFRRLAKWISGLAKWILQCGQSKEVAEELVAGGSPDTLCFDVRRHINNAHHRQGYMMPISERSVRMTLTVDHVGRVHRLVERPNERTDTHLTPLSDLEMEETARRLARDCSGRPLWLFVYGSLLWNPAFDHLERRRALVHGWRRAFCLNIRNYRATPETPGLMLALARGGSCLGAVFRLPDDNREARILTLLRREISYQEDLSALRWVYAASPEGKVKALAFYCAHPADGDYIYLPEDEQARRLATAVGYAGSCAEYLYNTVVHFEELGIRDTYLWRMQALVAHEIDRRGELETPGAVAMPCHV